MMNAWATVGRARVISVSYINNKHTDKERKMLICNDTKKTFPSFFQYSNFYSLHI